MALVGCRECGKQVSTEAVACPHCGAPLPSQPLWRGWGFEWKSEATLWGYPLVHIAFGRDERRRWRVAKGVIAIGQFGIGLITIAQLGVGILFGFGQVIFGLTALAQVAVSALFGVGQLATGYVAIGQVAAGVWVLAQAGAGAHVWSMGWRDPRAVEFFQRLWEQVRTALPAGPR